MKANGKYFAVRATVLAICIVSMSSFAANAEVVHGKFKLTTATHWGMLSLAPGDYEFTTTDEDTSNTMLTVRSLDSEWSGVVIAEAISDAKPGEGMKLELAASSEGRYVSALCLGEAGITLTYAEPKVGKLTRLTKNAAGGAMASASGGQQ
jgi:hypothetical protein